MPYILASFEQKNDIASYLKVANGKPYEKT